MNRRLIAVITFGLFIMSQQTAWAFTLLRTGGLRGWSPDDDTLLIHYNPTGCGISQSSLVARIQAAMDIWNSVPTAKIKLELGFVSNITATEASNFATALDNNSTSPETYGPTPIITCQSTWTSGGSTGKNVIPAVTGLAAYPVSDGMKAKYAYIMLNSDTSGSARIERFTDKKIEIILAHELGHVLGLGHTADTNSLMYFDATEKTELALSQDDMDGLTYLYPRNEIGRGAGGPLGCSTTRDIGDGGSGGRGSGPLELAAIAAALVAIWRVGRRKFPFPRPSLAGYLPAL